MMGGGMTGGGMMGGMGRMMQGMQHGGVWTINGIAATGHVMDPMLTPQHGRSCVLELANDTAWHHPIHPYGHSFRVLSRKGTPTRHRAWPDRREEGRVGEEGGRQCRSRWETDHYKKKKHRKIK